jgi:hypothetical protein
VLFNRIRSQKPRPFRCINGGHDPLQCKTGPSSTTATVQIGYDCMHARTQASKAWMPWQENLWLFSQGPDRPHHCNRRVMGLWWPWLLAQTTHIGFLHFYCTSRHVGPITDRWIRTFIRTQQWMCVGPLGQRTVRSLLYLPMRPPRFGQLDCAWWREMRLRLVSIRSRTKICVIKCGLEHISNV